MVESLGPTKNFRAWLKGCSRSVIKKREQKKNGIEIAQSPKVERITNPRLGADSPAQENGCEGRFRNGGIAQTQVELYCKICAGSFRVKQVAPSQPS